MTFFLPFMRWHSHEPWSAGSYLTYWLYALLKRIGSRLRLPLRPSFGELYPLLEFALKSAATIGFRCPLNSGYRLHRASTRSLLVMYWPSPKSLAKRLTTSNLFSVCVAIRLPPLAMTVIPDSTTNETA